MQYPTLLISDLHLTAQVVTDYRWTLFEWLVKTCREEKVKTLMILGDLTDAKDNHSAELVNRLVFNIVKLLRELPGLEIKILVGNHDWLKQGEEYFRFLNNIDRVQYITRPSEDPDPTGPSAFYLPYSKSPAKDWKDLDFTHYDYLFMHQTVTGAKSSNGQEMEGDVLPPLNAGKVYSGDIHVPQIIGDVEYVGSPYHVHFGDAFKPRCVLLERGGRPVNLYFETISRVTVQVKSMRELKKLNLREGDQVKLRIELTEAEKHDWSRMRRLAVEWLKAAKVEVCGVELIVDKSDRRLVDGPQAATPEFSPTESVERFVEAEELGGEALLTALEILES